MRPAAPLALLLALLGLAPAGADVSSEARTPWEVYERRQDVAETLLYVVRDLKVRQEERDLDGPALLLLVVDPTPSLADEIGVLADTMREAWREGPPGMRVGVLGVGAEHLEPSGIRSEAENALRTLAFLPVAGPKNLLAAVRDGAEALGRLRSDGPRSLLLVTGEGGDGEDDVERTRETLMDEGVSFYALAPEAAFERGWELDFDAPAAGDGEIGRRFTPEPDRRRPRDLFHGGETAIGLVPYRWEGDLAQTEFVWLRPPAWPIPSGFGYWCLATLAHATGGRYFVHDFTLPPTRPEKPDRRTARRTTLYDYSRLALLVPDLRPRSRILKDLARNPQARAIVRIWNHLADEAAPVIEVLGNLELGAGAMGLRPMRPVRSVSSLGAWMEDLRDVRRASDFALERIALLDEALRWWSAANAKSREEPERPDALLERVEADFQLLGVQLRKVRFHWLEYLALLQEIRPLHVTDRRVRLRPLPLARGFQRLPSSESLGSPERDAEFAALWLQVERMRERYRDTPWAYLLSRGRIHTYVLDVRIIDPDPPQPPRPERGGPGGTTQQPPRPAPPPADGPRPGSTTSGPTTGR